MDHNISDVVSCILEHFDESGIAQIATSSELLGQLPTILAMVGLSTNEIGLLALRRLDLAILVSLGAPVISPLRSFGCRNPLEIVKQHKREVASKTTAVKKW